MPLRLVLSGLLLLTALGLGLVGYQATRPPTTVTIATVPEAPPPPLTVDVLVAAHSLPAGTLMKEEDFTQAGCPLGRGAEGRPDEQPGGPRKPARRLAAPLSRLREHADGK